MAMARVFQDPTCMWSNDLMLALVKYWTTMTCSDLRRTRGFAYFHVDFLCPVEPPADGKEDPRHQEGTVVRFLRHGTPEAEPFYAENKGLEDAVEYYDPKAGVVVLGHVETKLAPLGRGLNKLIYDNKGRCETKVVRLYPLPPSIC